MSLKQFLSFAILITVLTTGFATLTLFVVHGQISFETKGSESANGWFLISFLAGTLTTNLICYFIFRPRRG